MLCSSSSCRTGSRSRAFLLHICSAASAPGAAINAELVTPMSKGRQAAHDHRMSAGRSSGREGIQCGASSSACGSAMAAKWKSSSFTMLWPRVASAVLQWDTWTPPGSRQCSPHEAQMHVEPPRRILPDVSTRTRATVAQPTAKCGPSTGGADLAAATHPPVPPPLQNDAPIQRWHMHRSVPEACDTPPIP